MRRFALPSADRRTEAKMAAGNGCHSLTVFGEHGAIPVHFRSHLTVGAAGGGRFHGHFRRSSRVCIRAGPLRLQLFSPPHPPHHGLSP